VPALEPHLLHNIGHMDLLELVFLTGAVNKGSFKKSFERIEQMILTTKRSKNQQIERIHDCKTDSVAAPTTIAGLIPLQAALAPAHTTQQQHNSIGYHEAHLST
jgi:hypothetical protein